MITAKRFVGKRATKPHYFRLESGKWVEHSDTSDFEPSVDGAARLINALNLPKCNYDKNYYRESGELVWATLDGPDKRNAKVRYTVNRTAPSE
jgi:hypothetical protein